MARNFYSHVRGDRIKWVITAIAFLVIAAILTAILTKGFTDFNPFCWFGHEFLHGECSKCGAVQQAAQTASAGLNAVIGR